MPRPYAVHVGDAGQVLSTLPAESVHAMVTDPPAGISFMGSDWDSDKGGRAAWIAWMRGICEQALRVLKPGAHAFVWALPRTAHWTATALEDAGFEIRDVVPHLFGNGFPKSLDVSKAIDAHLGAERPVVGTRADAARDGAARDAAKHAPMGFDFNSGNGNSWAAPISKPATPESAAWEGWGTALKPASEHWILARKPLSGTVAETVLAHGTGALNIDAARIAADDDQLAEKYASVRHAQSTRKPNRIYGADDRPRSELRTEPHSEGRWPANVIFSHPAQKVLGEHARYFYVAKPDRAERDAGLDGRFPKRPLNWSSGTQNPGSFQSPNTEREARNYHPTVKSVALMRYLCKLIAPPRGVIIDPFMGSGTTGAAALLEGFRFIGIEINSDYAKIAEARIRAIAPAATARRLDTFGQEPGRVET